MGRTKWDTDKAHAWSAFVRERMEDLGMNIRELAEAAGFSPAAVSLWLSGERRPSPTSCMALGNALFVDGNTLIELAGYVPASSQDPERETARRLIDQLPEDEMDEVASFLTWRLLQAKRKART